MGFFFFSFNKEEKKTRESRQGQQEKEKLDLRKHFPDDFESLVGGTFYSSLGGVGRDPKRETSPESLRSAGQSLFPGLYVRGTVKCAEPFGHQPFISVTECFLL